METEWIRQAKAGDDHAYQQLMTAHQEAVFRLAYLIVGDADDAHDVAQEAFIKAHRSLGRFDEAREFRPWILQITRNLARNHRRSIGRYWGALQRFARQYPPTNESIEAKTQAVQDADTLWKAVKQLNKDMQDVIYLRFFLELSVDETANTLNIAPGTVKSRLHRALNKLKVVIEEDYPELRERFE